MRWLVLLLTLLPAYPQARELSPAPIGGQAVELSLPDGRKVALSGLVGTANTNIPHQFEPGARTDLAQAQQDRWGRIILTEPELTSKLLKEGVAQLQPEQRTPTDAERAAEATAKSARLGLWKERCCALVAVEDAAKVTGQWRVVRGTVTAVSARRELVYVNFGTDWKTDFTLLLKPALAREIKPEDWLGKEVEARGWVEWYYGPAIRISTAAQILLPAAAE